MSVRVIKWKKGALFFDTQFTLTCWSPSELTEITNLLKNIQIFLLPLLLFFFFKGNRFIFQPIIH